MRGRLGRGLLAAFLLLAIAPAAQAFIRVTNGRSDPSDQVHPPAVALLAEDRAAIAEMPDYDDAIPVLTFHDVSDDTSSPYTVTPEQFAEHMEALDEAGFHTVTIADVTDLVSGRRADLPPRPILITFDDGIQGAWRSADPILAEHGFSAVTFIVTSKVPSGPGRSYYLDWATLGEMARTGRWEIGGHSDAGHPPGQTETGDGPRLNNRILDAGGDLESFESWSARVSGDLATNRQEIVDHLGIEPTAFAYPFAAAAEPGNDPRIAAELPRLVNEQFGLAFANQSPPSAIVETDDRMLLPRLGSVKADTTPSELLRRIAASVPVAPPTDITGLSWVPGGEGACTTEDKTVTVSSALGAYELCTPDVIHSNRWTDYTLEATVAPLPPDATATVSVRSSANGRIEVSVRATSIVIRELTGDIWTVLDTVDLSRGDQRAGRRVAVEVTGNELTVAIDGFPGDPIEIDSSLDHGLVSFGTSGGGPDGSQFVDVLLQVP